MSTSLDGLGSKLSFNPELRCVEDESSGFIKVWRRISIDCLVIHSWYDYINKENGLFGQCLVAKHKDLEDGQVDNPDWAQEPAGWKYEPENPGSDDWEAVCTEVFEHNQRFIFLEYLGEYKKVVKPEF